MGSRLSVSIVLAIGHLLLCPTVWLVAVGWWQLGSVFKPDLVHHGVRQWAALRTVTASSWQWPQWHVHKYIQNIHCDWMSVCLSYQIWGFQCSDRLFWDDATLRFVAHTDRCATLRTQNQNTTTNTVAAHHVSKLTSCYFLQGFVLSAGPEGGAEFPVNTLRTGDANLRLLRYNCERRMTQNCLLTHACLLRT
jgi:hypothetical protein